jgi:DNA topoisomerase-1
MSAFPSPTTITAARDARAVGLRYRFDDTPGIRRIRRGKKFGYVDADGRRITNTKELARIKRLAVPPAWTQAWISPDPDAHLLATGRDQRGRKQYRYHPTWRVVRDANKFDRMVAFAKALPNIRRAVECDLQRPGLPREKVLGAIVWLLEASLIRVGNDEYSRANHSYGLTTLRDDHVAISGYTVTFEFHGKGGKRHCIKVADRRLARIVKNCRDLPGYELFQYVDAAGDRHRVTSDDVNAYLREVSGGEFSAKDFRTWHGTVLAALILAPPHGAEDAPGGKRTITLAIEQVAARLGNTPAICRKCYIHPAVLEAFLDHSLAARMRRRLNGARSTGKSNRGGTSALDSGEAAVLRLLRARASHGVRPTRPSELLAALRHSVDRGRARPTRALARAQNLKGPALST